MRIADFFISLGFDIKGAPDVEKTDKAVKGLEFSSLKLLAGVTALNAAFYGMMMVAAEAGVRLQKFSVNTGLSSVELQGWQYRAERANVAGRDMTTAIMAIQKARAAIAFGDASAAAPWMLLGIDPRQNPFKVLEALRLEILKLDPAIARLKLSEMGFGEDMFYFLKNVGSGGLPKDLIVSPEESARLEKLAGAWRVFLFTLQQVGTRFAAEFAEPIAETVKMLTRALELAGRFVSWLGGGSEGATAFKYALIAIVVALSGLNIAAGILMLGPFGALVGTLGAMAVLVGGLTLLLQDLWVAAHGGKAAFEWMEETKTLVLVLEQMFKDLLENIEKFEKFAKEHKFGFDFAATLLGNPVPMFKEISERRAAWDVSQTNHITNNINGAQSPASTGREVGRSVNRAVSDAFGQMPLPAR